MIGKCYGLIHCDEVAVIIDDGVENIFFVCGDVESCWNGWCGNLRGLCVFRLDGSCSLRDLRCWLIAGYKEQQNEKNIFLHGYILSFCV